MESTGRVDLPPNYEDAEIDHLAILIADMLERLMTHNDRIPLMPESLTRFHSRSSPSISILDYLRRIIRFTNVDKSCLLITLHYIDQVCARMAFFTLSSLTCHRFIITSIAISSKALCDTFGTNNLYAKVGGIPVTELNILEREFLAAIEWRLMCTREVLQEYYINLVRTHSTNAFNIIGQDSPGCSSSSESSDMEPDLPSGGSNNPSRSTSPSGIIQRRNPSEGSTILLDSGTISPVSDVSRRPTIEQNMAFAALQASMGREALREVERERETENCLDSYIVVD